MKVLFLTNIPSPYRVDFFNELGKFCDLTVIYELARASDRDKEWKGSNAINFEEIYLKGTQIKSDGAICFSIIKHLRYPYDVIIVGGYSTPTAMLAINYMKVKKIPFILNSDGGFIKNDKKLIYFIKRYFISSAAMWLSSGDTTKQYLIHYGGKEEEIYFYPFTSIFDSDIVKSPLDSSEKQQLRKKLDIIEEKVVIAVGSFIERKGFDILLNAAKKFNSDTGVYIIGGEVTEEYRKIVRKLKLKNIHFLPFMNKELLKMYYQSSDLFILPTRLDIWGLVVNEAMANGLPIITTDKCIAGLELVKDNGKIIKSENIVELSYWTNTILSNEALVNSMSKKSIEIIKKYTINNMAYSSFNAIEIFYNRYNRRIYEKSQN